MVMYIFLTAVCVALAFFVNTAYRRELNMVAGKPVNTSLLTRQETIPDFCAVKKPSAVLNQ